MADSSERYVVVLHAGCWHTRLLQCMTLSLFLSLSLLDASEIFHSVKVCFTSFMCKFSFTGHLLLNELIELVVCICFVFVGMRRIKLIDCSSSYFFQKVAVALGGDAARNVMCLCWGGGGLQSKTVYAKYVNFS